jgi:uncharacterized glyoxalase superfamily protein PhnB
MSAISFSAKTFGRNGAISMNSAEAEKIKARYVIPIHEDELACRIMEAQMHVEDPTITRPDGYTPAQCLAISDPVAAEMARQAAKAAIAYWAECISAANRIN